MDWNNLTPIQLMALGAEMAMCGNELEHCRTCPLHKAKNGTDACGVWAIENPQETLKFYGVAEVDGEAALITLVDENNRLRKENTDQTTALAEALSAKEALEVELGDLQAANDKLREENEDIRFDCHQAEAHYEDLRKSYNEFLEKRKTERADTKRRLMESDLKLSELQGRAEGLLEALKIAHGSQTT